MQVVPTSFCIIFYNCYAASLRYSPVFLEPQGLSDNLGISVCLEDFYLPENLGIAV
jgi:hypothetical protein